MLHIIFILHIYIPFFPPHSPPATYFDMTRHHIVLMHVCAAVLISSCPEELHETLKLGRSATNTVSTWCFVEALIIAVKSAGNQTQYI